MALFIDRCNRICKNGLINKNRVIKDDTIYCFEIPIYKSCTVMMSGIIDMKDAAFPVYSDNAEQQVDCKHLHPLLYLR